MPIHTIEKENFRHLIYCWIRYHFIVWLSLAYFLWHREINGIFILDMLKANNSVIAKKPKHFIVITITRNILLLLLFWPHLIDSKKSRHIFWGSPKLNITLTDVFAVNILRELFVFAALCNLGLLMLFMLVCYKQLHITNIRQERISAVNEHNVCLLWWEMGVTPR